MSFPRYPSYNNSAVEWLGEVPVDWKIVPLKNVAHVVNGYPFDSELFDQSEGHPLIRIRDLNSSTCEAFYKGDFIGAAEITSRDVLVGMDGDFNVGRWRGTGRALLNQRMCCVRGHREVISRLLEYALPFPLKAINEITYSTTVKHLSSKQVEKIRFALPSGEAEQLTIIAFLDRETAKIDALVDEQKRLIELLKEKRQAVISHAVTKGLDMKAMMKQSGIERLGDVPEHWGVGTLTRVATRVVVGIAEAAVHAYVADGTPILRSTNIRPGRIVGEMLYVRSDFAADRNTKLIHAGDLVTVRTGHAGVTAVAPHDLDGCHCFTMLITSLTGASCPFFYCYWLNSVVAQHYFSIEAWGSAQPNISVPILKATPVPIPPFGEQVTIVQYLDRETSKIDALSHEADDAIALLEERRSALISAAVTGKIDLRGLVSVKAEAA